MKAYKYLMMCIMAASVAMYGCSSDEPRDEGPHSRMELTADQETISESEVSMAFTFFEEIYDKYNVGDNVLSSPLSKDLCLALVTNAVAEQDRTSLLGAYGAPTADVLNEFNNSRMKYFTYNSSKAKVYFANSFWANSPMMTNQDEFNAMTAVQKKYYDAEVRIMDFGKDDVKDAINSWCSDKTKGLISEFLKEEPASIMQFMAINALYFNCSWADEFKKSATKTMPFYASDGVAKLMDIPMMCSRRDVVAVMNDRYSAFQLPYASCNYSAVFVLPEKGLTIKDIIGDVKTMMTTRVLDEIKPDEYDIKVPRFECESSYDITDAVRKTGINFDGKKLLGFGPVKTTQSLQAVNLRVDEQGTTMAAVTSTGMVGSLPKDPKEIALNRPFLMIVKDDNHGSILLMAAIQMPKE